MFLRFFFGFRRFYVLRRGIVVRTVRSHVDGCSFAGVRIISGNAVLRFFGDLYGAVGIVGIVEPEQSVFTVHVGTGNAAAVAAILTAAYLLWAWQRAYLGVNPDTAKFPDVSAREFVVLGTFVLLSIALGVVPWIITWWTEPSVYGWVESLAVL